MIHGWHHAGDREWHLATCQTNPLWDSPFIIPRCTHATTAVSLSLSLSLSALALALLVYDRGKKGVEKGFARVQRKSATSARARRLWLSKLRVTFSKNERVHSISKREQRERPVRRILFGKNLTDEYRRKAVSMRVFEYTCFM